MDDFRGRVALVVAAGSGIGRASALIFARRGAKVVVADIMGAKAEETASLIRADGGEASALQVDGSSEGDVIALIDHVLSAYGRLDAAHNNVGDAGTYKPLTDVSSEEFETSFKLNTTEIS